MNKCFITKLPSSVDNDNLPVLGQLRINWLKQSNLTNNNDRYVELATNDSITVKVSGAHFTDSTLTSNLGNIKTITAADGNVSLYISNDVDAILTIDNKYSLTKLNFTKDTLRNNVRLLYFDINDIKYCTALTYLGLSDTQVTGNIDAVSNLINLKWLNTNNTKINGNISAVSNLVNLNYLKLSSTQVTGDINAVSNLTVLTYLGLNNTQISGDISAVSNLTNLSELYIMNTQVSGDIASLSKLTKLTGVLQLQLLSITGDMSKLPANINCIYNQNRPINTNFTWTAKGRQNATLLAMQDNIPFDTVSMDNMFIDQATCTYKPIESNPLTKIISVKGTRTSASDAAVAAIQNMGVTITGVTKQA